MVFRPRRCGWIFAQDLQLRHEADTVYASKCPRAAFHGTHLQHHPGQPPHFVKTPEFFTWQKASTKSSSSATSAKTPRSAPQPAAWPSQASRSPPPTGKTEWHNIVCFQRTAEVVRDYVKKGSQILIEGKIQTRSWDDKTSGEKKYKTEILCNELTLLGGKPAGEGASAGGYSKSNTASYDQRTPSSQPDYADVGITDDDIPF
jgi:single stranded DNA-binding protein